MNPRRQIGKRRHRASFQRHDATQDEHGQPTYPTDGDWDTVVANWPCEILNASGDEVIRGRQVTERTTHVLYGEYFGARGVTASMRMILNGETYAINTAFDPHGDNREMRIEARREE